MTINPLDFMKNLQKMQTQLGDFQEKLAEIVVTGSAAGGMVEVDMNGKMEVVAVRIAKDAVTAESGAEPDTEMLEDLIVAACASAREKVQASIQGEAGSMAQSMGIPPGMLGGFSNG
jgi:DNA-binding YbaB/EbfC family protein